MALLFVLLPFLGLVLLQLPVARPALRRLSPWLVLCLLLAQTLAVIFAPDASVSGDLDLLGLRFGGDPLSRVLLLAGGIVGMVTLVVGRGTLADGEPRSNFESLLLLAMAGMNGTVLVNDLFTLWVFLEITGVCSFLLISHLREARGLAGALQYLVLSAVASACMLAAIAFLYATTGTTSMAALEAGLQVDGFFPVGLAMALFAVGLFVKGGLVPFHGWLPDAYTHAPPAVSVLLAGIVTKTGGIYALLRLSDVLFGVPGKVQWAFLVVGGLTAVVGAVGAMGQRDMKRMLAWSSISQMGYVVLGLGAGNALGFAGAVFHLFNHAIFKTQLFVNAAAVEASTGTRDMDRLGGLSNRMPWTGGTSVVAFLSTAGIPPLAGFWSKLVIVVALYQTGNVFYAAVAVGTSLLTLAYFLVLQRKVFFGTLRAGLEGVREARPCLVVPAVVLSLVTIGTGLFFFYLLDSFIFPAGSILG